jgi:hypothetical protein
MAATNASVTKAMEKVAESVLKRSEQWTIGQKIAAALICLLAGAALFTGADSLRVASGVSIALLGVAFLTFRRRALESETIMLKDTAGRPRVLINAEGLVFLDKDSHPVVMMEAGDNGGLYFDRPRGGAGIYLNLTATGAVVSVGDKRGARIAILGANDGNLGLTLEDSSGDAAAVLGSIDRTAHLTFYGEDGKEVGSYPESAASTLKVERS